MDLIQQYENEMSALKEKYENEMSVVKQNFEPLLLAAIPDTWDVIKTGKYSHCIYNACLKRLNRKHSMIIEYKTHFQIKNIDALQNYLNTAITLDDVDRVFYIVEASDYMYDIRIKVRNNVFTIRYDSYLGSFEDTISLKNLCDILEKLKEISA